MEPRMSGQSASASASLTYIARRVNGFKRTQNILELWSARDLFMCQAKYCALCVYDRDVHFAALSPVSVTESSILVKL